MRTVEFSWRHAGLLVGLAMAYCLAALVSMSMFVPGEAPICVWFANVLAVGLLLRNREIGLTPASVAVFVGAMAANLARDNLTEISLLFATANAFSVAAGAFLVRRWGFWPGNADPDIRDYAVTLLLAGYVAPAAAGLAIGAAGHSLFDWPLRQTAAGWLAGDALSFSLFLPVLLLASKESVAALASGRSTLRLASWLVGCCLVALMGSTATDVPFIIVMVPMMLAAGSTRPFAMAIVAMAVGLTFVVAAMIGLTPARSELTTFANGYQVAVAITIVFPLLGALLIERLRREQRRIAESEQRFRRAMQDSAIGVVIVTLDGRILETNRAFADMLERSPSDLIGVAFSDIAHTDDVGIGMDMMRKVREGRAKSYGFEKRYLRSDGEPVWARVSGSVISDEETGAPLYLVSQIENIDASRKSAAALAEAEARWDFALACAGQGVWELDTRKGGVRYSATWAAMLGYAEGELDGDPDRWLMMVHPRDRDRIAEADLAHMQGRTTIFEAEFRMRHKSGHHIWILDRGKVLERDAEGNVTRAIGTLTNITQRKEAEQRQTAYAAALADEKERLKVTLGSIGDAVICTDAEDRVTFMNPVAEKLTGIRETAATGCLLETVYRSVDEETGEHLPARRLANAAETSASNGRAVLVRQDGGRCSIREVVSQIVNERQEFCGLVIVFQDFTDARTLQRELAHAASHDALTGLANRTSFMKTMTDLVAESDGAGNQHQLVYVDMDHFKSVNDTSGHAAGDALLKRVTEAIRRILKPGDFAARLGGDEFAIIFRSCDATTARRRAQVLVDRLAATEFEWRGRRHKVGASAGIAAIDGKSGAVDEIVARADEACYAAKAGGRGRIAATGRAA
ncbi:MAG: PAS domain S-box protein [Rhizobiaceae bacterium]